MDRGLPKVIAVVIVSWSVFLVLSVFLMNDLLSAVSDDFGFCYFSTIDFFFLFYLDFLFILFTEFSLVAYLLLVLFKCTA